MISKLEQRPFGRTGEQVTAVSLGGVGLPRVSFADGVATVHRALELGINYLDTAPLYSQGVAQAILGSIGIEALGLGPQNENTLGMTIYWSLYHSSVVRGLWWWFAPPIIVIVVLFIGLFLMSAGLDKIANPRLRRTA